MVALLWWLSAVESLLTLGSGKSVASCSFISMLTYFVHAEGHGNRKKINISYMSASPTPLPLIMLLKKSFFSLGGKEELMYMKHYTES